MLHSSPAREFLQNNRIFYFQPSFVLNSLRFLTRKNLLPWGCSYSEYRVEKEHRLVWQRCSGRRLKYLKYILTRYHFLLTCHPWSLADLFLREKFMNNTILQDYMRNKIQNEWSACWRISNPKFIMKKSERNIMKFITKKFFLYGIREISRKIIIIINPERIIWTCN